MCPGACVRAYQSPTGSACDAALTDYSCCGYRWFDAVAREREAFAVVGQGHDQEESNHADGASLLRA